MKTSENETKQKHSLDVKFEDRRIEAGPKFQTAAKINTASYSTNQTASKQTTKSKQQQSRPQTGGPNVNGAKQLRASETALRSNLEEELSNQYGQISGSRYTNSQATNELRQKNNTSSANKDWSTAEIANRLQKQAEDRRPSRSIDRGNTSAARPKSANKEKSRDYGVVGSQYSSVYSRILNQGEVNKIRKLVGEQNSDLDVNSH